MPEFPSSGSISISALKTHLSNGSNSLKTLSEAANEYEGYENLNNESYGMSEFYGHDTDGGVSVGGWPSGLPTWGFNWVSNVEQAFAWCAAEGDASNNRIIISSMKWNSSSFGTTIYGYINYTGLADPSFEVKVAVSTSWAYSNEGTGPFVPSGFPSNNSAYTTSYDDITTSSNQYRWLAQRQPPFGGQGSNPGTAQTGCTGFVMTIKLSDANLPGGYTEISSASTDVSNRVTEGVLQ